MTTNINPDPEAAAEDTFLAEETHARPDGSIDLLDLATRLLLLWRTFLLWTVIAFLLSALYVWHLKPLYEANATILPETKEDSGNNVAAYFSGHLPGDVFFALLSSRSVRDFVITRLGLMSLDHNTSMEAERGRLAGSTTLSQGRGNTIIIGVRDENADRAVAVANTYIDALEAQRTKMLLHDSQLRNSFFDQQIAQEAEALATAERDLEHVQENTGVVQPDAQTSIGLNTVASLHSQIDNVQVQLAGLLQTDTEQNPQVKSLRAQLNQLQGQLQSAQTASSSSGTTASIRQMPQLNLEIQRKQRLVKYHEGLFNSLTSQYESDRLSIGFAGNPFVVIDPAIKPETRAWPNRRLLYIFSLLFSILCGFIAVAFTLVHRRIVAQPEHRKRVAMLRNSFRISH